MIRTAYRHLLAAVCLSFMVVQALTAAPLTTVDYRIVGLELRPARTSLDIPKDIAGRLTINLFAGESGDNAVSRSLTDGTIVEATLRGPSFPARKILGLPNADLILPPLNLVGEYSLDNIRLRDEETGEVLLDANPSSVPINVFEEVLVSRVTSRPLSTDEIQEKGIFIDESNFRALEFEVGFVVDGETIPVKFPVVAPKFRQSTEVIPQAEVEEALAEAERINREIGLATELPPALEVSGLDIEIQGINVQFVDPSAAKDLGLQIPPIPALMVVPGKIGLLNQFFSVMLFTENAAPLGSGLSVHDLTAELILPPGPDQVRTPIEQSFQEPGDDPLRYARIGEAAEVQPIQVVVNPGFDGQLNTADDVGRLQPGDGGQAEFLVEGLREGLHIMQLELHGLLDGLGSAPVEIMGKAAGSVLVRNPNFSLAFSHPRTVRTGEPYKIAVTILNTSLVPANLVSISLPAASISGAQFLDPADDGSVDLGDIMPGETATAEFDMRALRTGSVTFSQLTSDSDIVGRFRLRTGVDERGVALSPDSIGYPEYADDFEQQFPQLFAAANRLLGQALSIATAPQLPPGVARIARSTMTARVLELSEAGQRLRYGDEAARVLFDFLIDWQGGRKTNAGFDQLLRETNAGEEFRSALAAALAAVDGASLLSRMQVLAADLAGRGEAWWIAAHQGDGLLPLASQGGGLAELAQSSLGDAAGYGEPDDGMLVTRPLANDALFGWDVTAASPSSVGLLKLAADGSGTFISWLLPALSPGDCLRVQPDNSLAIFDGCAGNASALIDPVQLAINESAPRLISAIQDIAVNVGRPRQTCDGPGDYRNYGNVVAALFSKPMNQDNVNVAGAYVLDNGVTATSVQIQPGGRVALLNLETPIGTIRSRNLTAGGITDPRGNPLLTSSLPVQTVADDGVAINGRVALANGQPAAGVPVTLTMYDAEQTSFECRTYVVRNAQVMTNDAGEFSLDFVMAGLSYSVSTTNTAGLPDAAIDIILDSASESAAVREELLNLSQQESVQDTLLEAFAVGALPEAIALVEGLDRALLRDKVDLGSPRIGSEVPVALRFRGRGIVTGTVVTPDGSGVNGAAVNLFPDPDSRELGRGVLSDGQGRFSFFGVPLGAFSIEATARDGSRRIVSERIDLPDEVVDLNIELSTAMTASTTLRGRIFESDAVSGHANGRVFVGEFIQGKFQNVVAAVTADSNGNWEANNIPIGVWDVVAVAFDGRTKAERRDIGAAEGVPTNVNLILQGRTTVSGRVEFADGRPVSGALVAGGDTVVSTDANGAYVLTGVPLGNSTISAGLAKDPANGIDFTRLGSARAEIVPGIDNFVVVRLEPRGRIAGIVIDAAGQPVPGVNVSLPFPDGSAFYWTTTRDDGSYSFDNLALRKYVVSAPAPPVQDKDVAPILDVLSNPTSGQDEILAAIGEAFAIFTGANDPLLNGEGLDFNPLTWGYTEVTLSFDGQTVLANIQYLREGSVSGTVLNGQGVPIGARVRLTGTGPDRSGKPSLQIRGERNSDPALGTFEFPGQALVGDWGIQVASPFYPKVLSTSGRTTQVEPDVNDLVMQFPPTREVNGRLAGTVLGPDGQPVGAGIEVAISFGDLQILTNDEGRFDTQIDLPAITDRGDRLSYSVVATDPATGLSGRGLATLTPGQTTEITVQLLDVGGLVVTVLDAAGVPVEGADVSIRGGDFPYETADGQSDNNGEALFAALFEGRYSIDAQLPSGPTTICARGSARVEVGQTSVVTVRLAPTGTVQGRFVEADGVTPIPFAQVEVAALGFAATDENGEFTVAGIPLGSYRILAQDPVNGRAAVNTADVSFEGEVVNVLLRVRPLTELTGSVIDGYGSNLVEGASVTVTFSDGITPSRTVTTDSSGYFSFPAVPAGPVRLSAVDPIDKEQRGSVSATIPEDVTTFNVDVPLRALANLEVQVLAPDETTPVAGATVTLAAPNNRSGDTDADGRVRFTGLALGAQKVRAESNAAGATRSVGETTVDLQLAGEAPPATVVLRGVGSVSGRLFTSDETATLAGREVRLVIDTDLIDDTTQVLSGADGEFAFDNLPIGGFRLIARDGALAASASGEITADGEALVRDLILSASGSVEGRLLRADGTPATNVDVVLDFMAPSGLLGKSVARTNDQGEFMHTEIPVGPVKYEAVAIAFPGIARGDFELTTNGELFDLGDIVLDEVEPFVIDSDPFPGTEGVPISTTVSISFSEALAADSIDPSGIYLRDGDTTIPASLTLREDDQGVPSIVEITPDSPLASERQYEAVVVAGDISGATGGVVASGPRDLVDRPLRLPAIIPFVTRDDEPPGVLSFTPDDGSEANPVEGVIRLSFNEPVMPEGLVIAVFDVEDNPVPGTTAVGVGGLVAVFTPESFLDPNTNYRIEVSGIKDLAGNAALNQPLTGNFDTLDTMGPEIAVLRLKDGVLPIAGSMVIVEAVLAVPEAEASMRLSEDLVTVGQSEPGILEIPYMIPDSGSPTLRAVAIDRFGNEGPLGPELVLNILANQPPQINFTQVVPASGPPQSGGSLTVLVTATDDVGVAELRTAAIGGCAAPVQIGAETSVLVECDIPPQAGPDPPVSIIAEAADANELTSGEQKLNVSIVDGTPPDVAIVSPAEDVTPAAGGELTIEVSAADNFGVTEFGLTIGGAFDDSQIQVISSNTMAATTFTVAVPAELDGGEAFTIDVVAKDAAGFSANASRTLTTEDRQPPLVEELVPVDGASSPTLVPTVGAKFSEALDPASINEDTLMLEDTTAGRIVGGKVLLSDDGTELRFRPTLPLAPDTAYQLALNAGPTDLAGNPLVDASGEALVVQTVSFSTGTLALGFPQETTVLPGDAVPVFTTGTARDDIVYLAVDVDGEVLWTALPNNLTAPFAAPETAELVTDPWVDWVDRLYTGGEAEVDLTRISEAPDVPSKLIYFEDFEAGAGEEWSDRTTTDNPATTQFLGRFSSTTGTTLSLPTEPGRDYEIELDVWALDSLDPDTGAGADRLLIDVDGIQVFDAAFTDLQTFVGQIGFNNLYSDDIIRSLRVRFTATAATTAIRFYDNGLQPVVDESWGLDNVRVYTEGGAALAGGRVDARFYDNIAANGPGDDVIVHGALAGAPAPTLLGREVNGGPVTLALSSIVGTQLRYALPDGVDAIDAIRLFDNGDAANGFELFTIEALHSEAVLGVTVLQGAVRLPGYAAPVPIGGRPLFVEGLDEDTDGDGLTNGVERDAGLDPFTSDIGVDSDNDQLDNIAEILAGTDPFNEDSDQDGIIDGLDPAPLASNQTPFAGTTTGSVLVFDGIDDLVLVENSDAMALTDAVTVEAWVQVNNPNEQPHVLARQNQNLDEVYKLGVRGGGLPEFRINQNQGIAIGPEALQPGVWYHLAGTYDGSTSRLYVDGQEVANVPFSAPMLDSTGGFTIIGADIDRPDADPSIRNQFLEGQLDEIRVWSVARSPAEIEQNRLNRLSGNESNLVAYWPLDDGEGLIIDDRSVNELDGMLGDGGQNTQPTWTESNGGLPEVLAGGSALRFDGDDRLIVANAPELNLSTLTIEAWVKRDPGGLGMILNKERAYEVSIRGAQATIQWAIANGSPSNWDWVDTNVTVPEQEWTHVAVSFDGGFVHTYLNGELRATQPHNVVIPATTETLQIGSRELGDQFFSGIIDEIRLWNVARSDADIAANYDRRVQTDENGIVALWRFDEGTGLAAEDATGNGRDGTLAGGIPVWTEDTPPIRGVDAIEVATGESRVITLQGSDPDDDPLTAIIVALPDNGALFQTDDGLTLSTPIDSVETFVTDPSRRVVYVPNAGFTGPDSFDYRVNDGFADSNLATVALIVTGADSDGDGLSDSDELNVYGTDPFDADTDEDTLSDGTEVLVHATDPLNGDPDDDGLDDPDEIDAGTDPFNPDSDDDLIPDGIDSAPTVADMAFAITSPLDGSQVVETQLLTLEAAVVPGASVPWVVYRDTEGRWLADAAGGLSMASTIPVPPVSELAGSVFDVRAYRAVPGENLAPLATVSASSSDFSSLPSYAADSNTDGSFFNQSVWHSANENHPWLELDLGSSIAIRQIDIYLRTDCCGTRNRIAVLVADTPFVESDFDGSELPTSYSNGAVEVYRTTASFDLGSISVPVGGVGRYVRIVHVGQDWMHLAEVEVYPLEISTRELDSIQLQVQPIDADNDSDTIPNGDELTLGFDPFVSNVGADFDTDGIDDVDEFNTEGLDPLNPDSDGDGFPDGQDIFPVAYNLAPVAGVPVMSNALDFDGIDDIVSFPIDLSLLVTGNREVTMEAWIRVDAVDTDSHSQSVQAIVHKGNNGAWEYGLYVLSDLRLYMAVYSCPGSGISIAGGELGFGTWHHVAGVVEDDNSLALYIDGQQVASRGPRSVQRCASGNEPIVIGGRGDGQRLDAAIDEVRIWDIARTATEITQTQAVRLEGDEPNLVAYWPLDEGSGSTTTSADGAVTGSFDGATAPAWVASDADLNGKTRYVLGGLQPLTIELFVRYPNDSAFTDFTRTIQSLPTQGTLFQTLDGATLGASIDSVGTEVIDPQGRVIYLPSALGLDEFTYTASDGLIESWPATVEIGVSAVDSDGDGLTDDDETNFFGTDPFKSDTDGDGFDDGVEVNETGTDPLLRDTNGDGIDDAGENVFLEGFESIISLVGSLGIGNSLDVWYADWVSAVESSQGISPFEGNGMGQFRNTCWSFSLSCGGSTGGEKLRFIDLSEYAAAIDAGNATLLLSAQVNRVAGDAQTDDYFLVEMRTHIDPIRSSNWFSDADQRVFDFVNSDADPATWEKLETFVRLLPGVRYVAVRIIASENVFNDSSGEFDGHYIDDVRVDIVEERDSDNDGLSDLEETELHGTNPALPDTDGDGLSDGDEVLITGTDPLEADTDGDGIEDDIDIDPLFFGHVPQTGDRIGRSAAQFDGIDDFYDMAGDDDPTFSDAVTVETWFRTDSQTSGTMTPIHLLGGAVTMYLNRFGNHGMLFIFDNSSVNESIEFSSGLNDGEWHHAAAVYDRGEVTIYVDGEIVGTKQETLNLSQQRIPQVGRRLDPTQGPFDYFEGELDELRLWNIARTREEITADMHRVLPVTPPGLVQYWRFDDANDSRVNSTFIRGEPLIPGGGGEVFAPLIVDSTAPIFETPESVGIADSSITIALPGYDADEDDADSLAATIESLPVNGRLYQAISTEAVFAGEEITSVPATVDNDENMIIYVPDPGFIGSDSFEYLLKDSRFETPLTAMTVNVTPDNTPPNALGDSISTPLDTAITFDPLINDTDPDGDLLALVEFTQPSKGIITRNTDGSLTYTPFAGQTGSDSFEYTIKDDRVWRRADEYEPGLVAGSMVGNPFADEVGERWWYEYVLKGSRGTWYQNNSRTSMVWDDSWFGSSGLWVRSNDLSPFIDREFLLHHSAFGAQGDNAPVVRWRSPYSDSRRFDIEGTMAVFWSGSGALGGEWDIDTVIARAHADDTFDTTLDLFQHENPVAGATRYEFSEHRIRLRNIDIDAMGGLLFSLRPDGRSTNTWNVLQDDLTIRLSGPRQTATATVSIEIETEPPPPD